MWPAGTYRELVEVYEALGRASDALSRHAAPTVRAFDTARDRITQQRQRLNEGFGVTHLAFSLNYLIETGGDEWSLREENDDILRDLDAAIAAANNRDRHHTLVFTNEARELLQRRFLQMRPRLLDAGDIEDYE